MFEGFDVYGSESKHEISEYLSYKFGKNIKPMAIDYYGSYIFEYDVKRVLKLDTNMYDQKLRLFTYLMEHSNELPIAKIYSIGKIDIPTLRKSGWNNSNKRVTYILMEKLDIPKILEEELSYIKVPMISEMFYQGNIDIYEDRFKAMRGREFTDKEKKLFDRIVEILTILQDHGIKWADVHAKQFGYNHKKELVAIDMDSWVNFNDGKIMKPKNIIRENINYDDNKILKRFIHNVSKMRGYEKDSDGFYIFSSNSKSIKFIVLRRVVFSEGGYVENSIYYVNNNGDYYERYYLDIDGISVNFEYDRSDNLILDSEVSDIDEGGSEEYLKSLPNFIKFIDLISIRKGVVKNVNK